MAGSATDFWEKKIADLLFGGAAFSAVTPLFFGLLTDKYGHPAGRRNCYRDDYRLMD
jgi:hypothetical protein